MKTNKPICNYYLNTKIYINGEINGISLKLYNIYNLNL